MSLFAYISLLPAFLIGFLIVIHIFESPFTKNPILLIFLSIPLGFGITSCTYFLWSFFFQPNSKVYFFLEFVIILVMLIWAYKRKKFSFKITQIKFWDNKIDLILGVFGLSIIVISLITFLNYTGANPHGRYDAWAIWNLRARMIARSTEEWKIIFNPAIFHADYPLLVPLTIARVWVLAGTESLRIPQAIAGIYTFICAGILGAGLANLKTRSLAWLSIITLLGTPWVVFIGSKQFADLPLAANILSAIVCLTFALVRRNESKPWLFLAGLFCGFAGWTKNEGLLFVICFVVTTLIAFLLQRRSLSIIKSISFLAIGLFLPLSVIVLFKLNLAPSNDLFNANDLSATVSFLLTPARYSEVFREITNYPEPIGGWLFPVLPILLLYAFITFNKNIDNELLPKFIVGLIILFQWIGYFLIYVITPHDIRVHVIQSYDRLLMHIYPAFLFWLFFLLKPIEKVFPAIKKSI
jgi:energy-converting hydrogenase Eha subunit C